MEGNEFFENREILVFVSDQKAFSLGGGYGCTLFPLMTLPGEPVEVNRLNFPNNGRVWWHLGITSPDQVLPGVIWVGELERHPGFDSSDPRKSCFQAGFDKKLSRGDSQLIEILDVDADTPDIDAIRRGTKMSWDHPPTGTIILRGRNKTLGPLKCSWDSLSQKLTISPISTVSTHSYLINSQEFDAIVKKRSFDVPINEASYYGAQYRLKISLTRQDWFTDEIAQKVGKPVDISTDDQIINWAVRQKIFEATNTERATIKRFISSLEGNTGINGDLKIERLRLLSKDYGRVISLGEEAAKVLAESSAFSDLLRKHIDEATKTEVAREKKEKVAEIEKAIEPLVKRKKQLNQEIKAKQLELDEKEKEQIRVIKEKKEEILGSVLKREQALEAREAELDKKDKVVTESLRKASERFTQDVEKISTDVLSHLPFLKEIFGLPKTDTVPVPMAIAPKEVRKYMPIPRTKKFTEQLSESDFLDQFSWIVSESGFNFRQDDLTNFHVCMKVDALTILAGPSGTGKSSLPRLYAKALGAYEEYLEIPVRPDWLDDRDLVGFYNSIAQCYEPGRSDLIGHLIRAEKDLQQGMNGIYLTCLDEMNLSRVEHYFAQFLSVLERDAADRVISLFPAGLGYEDDPFFAHREILLGKNLKFVGTVNIDETTHFFSPKLIDRAQIVSLGGNGLNRTPATGVNGSKQILPIALETYRAWTEKVTTEPTAAEGFLLAIHEILKTSRLGFEHRSYARMLDYIRAALPVMGEEKALDNQLTQVVFPKLKRTAPGFKKTLTHLIEKIPKSRFPKSSEILQRLADADNEEEYFQLL